MGFVAAICTACGATLQVDSTHDAAICKYCGTPFIVEKAINNYNVTNHIHADSVNVFDSGKKDFEIRAGVLIKYNGSQVDVVIPDGVVAIKGTFNGCSGLRSVVIPDSVREIGESAFTDCVSLTNITIPNSVTAIGGWAFSGCTSLTNIVIPDSVSTIVDCAFDGCASLTNVTITNSITTIGKHAFDKCQNLLMSLAHPNLLMHFMAHLLINYIQP